jgi:trk system potassium uptake protein TrkH
MGSLNFYHHYFAVTRLNLGIYFKNTEIKVQMAIIAAITLLGLMLLTNTDSHSNFFDSFVNSLFHTVSLATTTGYSADNFSQWPSFIPILMLLAGVIGGCVGSTTGGFKVMRLVVLFKQGLRELKSLSHPNGIFSLKMDNMLIPNKVASAVAGFIAIYMLLFFLIMILLMATGLDFISAFTSAIASLANVGPGLGDASEHFAYFSDSAKWIMSCAMLLGRLEIFTLLILLTPTYWRS